MYTLQSGEMPKNINDLQEPLKPCVEVMIGKKGKILVVEDNDFVRMQLVQFLNDEGYETLEATCGQSALDLMSADIHLAVVDVRMHPVNGVEFLQKIRVEQNNSLPVIMVTGCDNPILEQEAEPLNVSAILHKPVPREKLLETVASSLRKKQR